MPDDEQIGFNKSKFKNEVQCPHEVQKPSQSSVNRLFPSVPDVFLQKSQLSNQTNDFKRNFAMARTEQEKTMAASKRDQKTRKSKKAAESKKAAAKKVAAAPEKASSAGTSAGKQPRPEYLTMESLAHHQAKKTKKRRAEP